ncbi:hypothetical protein [Winogradskyella forsetii]|uniref:hypothetical protein n=1 Tax=Winogradskyella forsetii TaxID=2686077 RepID=UPI0015BBBE4E|nr:hypothetical protein [Winogradskyella forsetii]
MKAIIHKDNYLSHLIGLTLVLMAISDILQSKEVILVSALLSFGIFILCFPMKERFWFSEAMIFVVFLIVMSLINLFFTENGLGGSITLMGNLLLAYVFILLENKKLTFWVVLSYAITIGFIAYKLFIINADPNEIYEGLSRNHAGFVVVFWTGFLMFYLKITYNLYLLIFPIFGLILSFFLFGRTSLIVSALLVLLVFFYKFRKNRVIQFLLVSALVAVCYYLFLDFGDKLTSDTNLGAGLDTPRWELWRIYLEHINFVNLFTGVDVSVLPMYDQFSGNPHNSFIKFHSRAGIGSIVFIILFFVSIFKYIKYRHYYILWLLLLLTIRASFDGDMFVGNFDFIFLIITFYWIKTD